MKITSMRLSDIKNLQSAYLEHWRIFLRALNQKELPSFDCERLSEHELGLHLALLASKATVTATADLKRAIQIN